ncbi:hypothetical protein F5X99DRAFT_367557 [Biscogniauxia marginata]|nr:hypothetical protein F5X99DRAFT_367557 [Biscogniauxia marginata]
MGFAHLYIQETRENAIELNTGYAIRCVVVKSFASEFSRNLSSLCLTGFEISNHASFDLAQDSEEIEINLVGHTVYIAGQVFWYKLGVI